MPRPHADASRTVLLRAAVRHCTAIVDAATARVRDSLDARSQAALRPADRDLLQRAQADLLRNRPRFVAGFEDALQAADGRAGAATRPDAGSSWQSLTLVDDSEVEERLSADRVARQIGQECEPQLRDLASYMGTLLGTGRADEDRHPLTPERIGDALCKAVRQLSPDPDVRALLVREFTANVAQAMPTCYDTVIAELEESGVQPLPLVWRTTPGHSGHPGGGETAAGTPNSPAAPTAPTAPTAASAASAFGRIAPAVVPSLSTAARADADLMALLRRLNDLARREFDHRAPQGAVVAGPPGAAGADDLPSLLGLNLIHAHREALQQASPAKIDHMVIDVVGTLFDQILSDTRVPPQMARQIARLQLPVLRVAMADAGFFSSRRHPVRRFVNRIASLACPFDDFDSGPGKAFLDRVHDLVQDIIDGDFDQPELYVAKLAALEDFASDQHRDEPQANAAATLFDAKESELRVQQRYRAQLQAALAPVPMDDGLRTFVTQVWSQALVAAVRSDGPQSPQAQRARQVAVELVMSVQPKGLPMLRKKFLMQLPGLMKDLNAGMQLVGWPASAQKAFFDRLLPAHAESLKAKPSSELEHNLLAKQLEAIFQAPIPAAAPDDPFPTPEGLGTGASDFEPRISDADAARVGLLRESAVDWSAPVDIDLSDDVATAGPAGTAATPDPAFLPPPVDAAPVTADGPDAPAPVDAPLPGPARPPTALDLDLTRAADRDAPPPAELARGPALVDHVRVGFAYQMHLHGAWHKVRLSHVSPGRAFFVFTHGARHRETVSLTARMLRRLCETHRLRAFENAYLLERATARARQQLAAIKSRY